MIRVTSNPNILLNNFQRYLQYRTQYFDSALLITLVLASTTDRDLAMYKCYILLPVYVVVLI